MAEVRIRSTSLHERREATTRSLERVEDDLARERKREAELRREEEEGRSRQDRLTQEITTLQHSLGVLRQQEAQEAEGVHRLQSERDQLRQTLFANEETIRAVRRDLGEAQQQQASVATKRAALTTERSLLQKRWHEEVSQGGDVPEVLRKADSPQDPQALELEGEELRRKISAMGPVNMAALEEYEALSDRYHFLRDQADDLITSVTSLKATIAEINQTIEDRFGHTLTAVNQHLNRFWQRLFEGGEAEIVLGPDEEAEEPGVEIHVRIPGKRTTILFPWPMASSNDLAGR